MKADNIERLHQEILTADILKMQLVASFGEDDNLVKDTIEGETNLHEIMQTVIEDIGETQAQIDGLKLYQDKLNARKQTLKKRIDFMKTLLKVAMEAGKLGKTIKFPSATLSLKTSTDKADYYEEADIPSEFYISGEPKLCKDLIVKQLRENKAKLRETIEQRIASEFPEVKTKSDREEKYQEILDGMTEDELRPFEIPGVKLVNDGPILQIRML